MPWQSRSTLWRAPYHGTGSIHGQIKHYSSTNKPVQVRTLVQHHSNRAHWQKATLLQADQKQINMCERRMLICFVARRLCAHCEDASCSRTDTTDDHAAKHPGSIVRPRTSRALESACSMHNSNISKLQGVMTSLHGARGRTAEALHGDAQQCWMRR